MVRLFKIADRYAKAEEGRPFVHNLPEEPPPKFKTKNPKRNEAAAITTEPNQKKHRGECSEHDKGG
jgi:hypothetical protein